MSLFHRLDMLTITIMPKFFQSLIFPDYQHAQAGG